MRVPIPTMKRRSKAGSASGIALSNVLPLAVRRAVMTYARGPFTVELGKQFVRWGQTDILSPTDRFTPRDYLIVVSSDPLAVTAARVTLSKGSNSLGLVYLPRMTPSRLPILTHRWAGLRRPARHVGHDSSTLARSFLEFPVRRALESCRTTARMVGVVVPRQQSPAAARPDRGPASECGRR